MDRRNFFKILSTSSAGLVAGACGSKSASDQLIPLLVADAEIVPGHEQWHPSICEACSAGCGVIVRVMAGERIVERDGHQVRERIATIKKIEGNPLDAVSGGRLCARGQAEVQALYHPDRLRGPMKRTGARGSGAFAPASWDAAITEAAAKLSAARAAGPSKIVFLTGPGSGTRSATIARFLEALGAPPPVVCSLPDFPIERKAAELVHNWNGLPVYDLARARYVLGVGADFLGGWASPVFYSRQYGEFRQGRHGVRGSFVHAESRFSLTASNADRWLPILPGTEPQFLLAVMRLLADANLARNLDALPPAVRQRIDAADVAALIRSTGVREDRLRDAVRELGQSEAPLVIAGASAVHTNSLDAMAAAGYLNVMLGNVGHPGGVLPPAPAPASQTAPASVTDALAGAQVVLIDGSDPVYSLPAAAGVAQLLERAGTVLSFAPFLNDSGTYADLLLPDHHALESASAVIPAVAVGPAAAVATPFVKPLHDTRPLAEVLSQIAAKLPVPFEAATPQSLVATMLPADRTFAEVAREGGLWLDPAASAAPAKPAAKPAAKQAKPKTPETQIDWNPASFDGAADQFPFYFQPYLSVQYHDGSGAHLPWMQELPDPASSAMWSLPIELDPKTAAKLGIATGDLVRVESPHGRIDAPAFIHPAAIPGVVSMPIGGGHKNYTRYASNRGANPLSILAASWEKSTGALATGATRVRLTRLGSGGGLIQFSRNDKDHAPYRDPHHS